MINVQPYIHHISTFQIGIALAEANGNPAHHQQAFTDIA
jgi:hypothetical protein